MKSQIPAFQSYLTSQSKSENTIKSYISDLNHYFSLHNSISRSNIQQYKSQISNLSTTTINRKLTSLKQFNEYLLSNKLIDAIHIIKSDFIKMQQKGNPTEITDKQVKFFLNKVNTKPTIYKSRNIALIYLIANTGIRREEVCNLKLKNLDLTNNELAVLGKGNKERTVLLNDDIVDILNLYLLDRQNHKHSSSPYLFLSERGEKLTKETINSIFDFYCTPKYRITPHQLRHHWATSVLEQDVLTLPELQNQLGHSSMVTVSIYAHARKSNIKKKINKLKIGS